MYVLKVRNIRAGRITFPYKLLDVSRDNLFWVSGTLILEVLELMSWAWPKNATLRCAATSHWVPASNLRSRSATVNSLIREPVPQTPGIFHLGPKACAGQDMVFCLQRGTKLQP